MNGTVSRGVKGYFNCSHLIGRGEFEEKLIRMAEAASDSVKRVMKERSFLYMLSRNQHISVYWVELFPFFATKRHMEAVNLICLSACFEVTAYIKEPFVEITF